MFYLFNKCKSKTKIDNEKGYDLEHDMLHCKKNDYYRDKLINRTYQYFKMDKPNYLRYIIYLTECIRNEIKYKMEYVEH